MSTKKLIAFDLDGTLAPSKSPLHDRMGELLDKLLDKYQVCVISGGKITQFESQLLANLRADPLRLTSLHLMPTCGTRYYRYDLVNKDWQKVYAEDFTPAEKEKIMGVLTKVTTELGLVEKKVWGDVLEDRGSQVTWSALGQDIAAQLGPEGVHIKEAWDTDNVKKNKVRDAAAELLPEFEVRVGGVTSVDITKPGIDKAYGMHKLMDMLEISKDEILFVGDRIQEGGNDYPVRAMGIDCLEVDRWEDTARVVEGILYVS